MSAQHEALRLADALQAGADDPMWADHCEMNKRTAGNAAFELRRLHAENEALREALKQIERGTYDAMTAALVRVALAAIDAAKERT